MDISFEYFLSFILDYVKNDTDLPHGWEIGSVAFLSFVDRDTHPTCTRCRGNVCASDMICDICAVGRRLSGNKLYRRVLTKRKKSSRPSGSVPTAPPTSPCAETSSGVSSPGTSSSSLPLGGQGKQEGSQGAPGVLSGGASSPPA